MIYCDTETCGFHGPTVLIQYAEESDRDIYLHDVWSTPKVETMELIEHIVEEGIIGFNLAFDAFHLIQTYTTLSLMSSGIPDIDEYAAMEFKATQGRCLKFAHALDLMLYARKGPYQSTMDRSDIRIRRVPSTIASDLAAELTRRVPLPDIYFARKKDPTTRWKVYDIKNDLGEEVLEFKDVVLKFSPSIALKALAHDVLGHKDDLILKFVDIEVDPVWRPVELGYAPYATAIGKPGKWNGAWPEVIQKHIDHWAYNKYARQYAKKDVQYTYELHDYFKANPVPGIELQVDDVDSTLACMVAAVRWKGYKIDIPKIKELRTTALERKSKAQYNFNSPEVCRRYLMQTLNETESVVLSRDGKLSTRGQILEHVAKWREAEVCDACEGMGCDKCDEGLINSEELHPAAARALEILDYRHAGKEIELYEKLLTAGRFFASFKVIGTLSSRMSGADGLNAQGIKHDKVVRACFPLADTEYDLSAGDFSGFEVCLADAVYNDPKLHAELLKGKKIHGLFGTKLFPDFTYEQILATDGLEGDKNKYSRSKQSVFAMLYGGEAYTLSTRAGVPEKVAEQAYREWVATYTVWGECRSKIIRRFCTIRQEAGIGSRITWADPDEYMASMLGFRRYFSMENKVAKALFEIAEDPPAGWDTRTKVVRRDREQSAQGAARSAVFAAAFAIQASNMRAACNHEIQSTGAELTKILEARIWGVQPAGINGWRVQPMNVHDEILTPTWPTYVPEVKKVVTDFVEEYKSLVPLLAIDWHDKIENWSQK